MNLKNENYTTNICECKFPTRENHNSFYNPMTNAKDKLDNTQM
jgi:hypothetical protein